MKIPQSPFYRIVQLIFKYIYFIVQYIKSLNQKKQIVIEHVETQYEKSCKKYASFYAKKTDDENSNICDILYDYDKRKEIFADPNNIHEKQWKSRILIENTPRGNVMMYYNPYTLSYHYYSDEQIIPYKILEQVATKYVVMYRCKDFFVDMVERPDNKILDIFQKEEDSLKSKKMKVNDITKCVNAHSDSKDVFASLKDYRGTEKPKTENPKIEKSTPSNPYSSTILDKKPPVVSKFSNKFVRIGKMCEFNIIQKPVNKQIETVNEMMFGETPVNKVIDFFDDLEIVENPAIEMLEKPSSYKMFKIQQNTDLTAKLKTV